MVNSRLGGCLVGSCKKEAMSRYERTPSCASWSVILDIQSLFKIERSQGHLYDTAVVRACLKLFRSE